MRAALRAISIGLAVLVLVFGAVGSIRWAKRHSSGAQFLASAMMLVLGIGGIPIVHPPAARHRGGSGAQGKERVGGLRGSTVGGCLAHAWPMPGPPLESRFRL